MKLEEGELHLLEKTAEKGLGHFLLSKTLSGEIKQRRYFHKFRSITTHRVTSLESGLRKKPQKNQEWQVSKTTKRHMRKYMIQYYKAINNQFNTDIFLPPHPFLYCFGTQLHPAPGFFVSSPPRLLFAETIDLVRYTLYAYSK